MVHAGGFHNSKREASPFLLGDSFKGQAGKDSKCLVITGRVPARADRQWPHAVRDGHIYSWSAPELQGLEIIEDSALLGQRQTQAFPLAVSGVNATPRTPLDVPTDRAPPLGSRTDWVLVRKFYG